MVPRIQSLIERVFPPVYSAALIDPVNIRDNPIAEREARREARRKDLWILLFVCGATLMGMFVLYAWIIGLLAASRVLRGGIPRPLGGSYGTSLFILICGIHAWFVLHAAHRKTGHFFVDEYRRNTLHGLLSVASTPFQIVLQAAVHPFRQAMLVALMGLPFYLYTIAIGGISWLDLLGLYILFAIMAFRPPRWHTPVFGGIKPEEIVKKGRRGGSGGAAAWTISIFWMMGTMGRVFDPVFGAGWQLKVLSPAWNILPPHAQSIAWTIVLAWPLMFARWMMTAEPFFGIKLPPVLLVPPLIIAGKLMGAWLSGMYLRIEEKPQLDRLWDSIVFGRARFFFESAVLFVAFGYMWHPYVDSRLTASLIRTKPGSPEDALAGLLWMLGSIGAIITWSRCWKIRFDEDRGRVPGSLLWAATPFLTMLGTYAVGCILAGRNPFPLPALEMLVRVTGIAAGGAIMARLAYSRLFLPLTLGLLPFLAIATQATWPGTAASPIAGLLFLSDHVGGISNNLLNFKFVPSPWWLYALVPAVLGLIARGRVRVIEQVEREAEVRLAPLTMPPEGGKKPKYAIKRDMPLALRTIDWLQTRWDNAVMIKELRVKLRGHMGKAELFAFLALFASPIVLCFIYPDILPLPVEWLSGGLFSPNERLSHTQNLIAAPISIISLMCAVMMPFVGAFTASTAFARERDRSTLVFLLVTPMPTARIVLGKLIGLLLPTIMLLLAAAIWMALITILLAPSVGPAQAITGWTVAALMPFVLLLWGSSLGLASASLMKKEADAAGVAMLGLFLSAWLYGYLYAVVLEGATVLQRPALIAPGFLICSLIFTLTLLALSISFACWRVGRWRLSEGEKAG